MKKLFALLLAACMVFAMAACGEKVDTGDDNDGQKTYVVGICQIVQHAALDAATQGFKDALNELLPGQVTFKEGNAGGDPANCATIVNGFVSAVFDRRRVRHVHHSRSGYLRHGVRRGAGSGRL